MQINKNEVADYVSFLHTSDQNLFFLSTEYFCNCWSKKVSFIDKTLFIPTSVCLQSWPLPPYIPLEMPFQIPDPAYVLSLKRKMYHIKQFSDQFLSGKLSPCRMQINTLLSFELWLILMWWKNRGHPFRLKLFIFTQFSLFIHLSQ